MHILHSPERKTNCETLERLPDSPTHRTYVSQRRGQFRENEEEVIKTLPI